VGACVLSANEAKAAADNEHVAKPFGPAEGRRNRVPFSVSGDRGHWAKYRRLCDSSVSGALVGIYVYLRPTDDFGPATTAERGSGRYV